MASFAVSAVWLLSLLTALVLMEGRPLRAGAVVLLAAGFAVAATVLFVFTPSAGAVGLLVALTAGARLLWPQVPAPESLLAGVCAGAAAALHASAGVERGLSLPLAASALLLGMALISRCGTPLPRAPLLCFIALSAGSVGLAPDFAAGWHSAVLLNQPLPRLHAAVPPWTLLLAGAALLAGLCKGAWTHR